MRLFLSPIGILSLVLLASSAVQGFKFIKKPTSTVHVISVVDDSNLQPIYVDKCRRSNEVWYDCLPACEITCANLNRTCEATTTRCLKGCECARGYARQYQKGPCEPISLCPGGTDPTDPNDQCDVNEVFYKHCGRSCDEECAPEKTNCSTRCQVGCFCKKGYRRVGGVCVPKTQCPSNGNQCDANEVYKCSLSCKEKCDVTQECLEKASSYCVSDCYCDTGFVRDNKGNCVSRATACDGGNVRNCSGINEKYVTCGRSCLEKCEVTAECLNSQVCDKTCICEQGYKRINGQCLPEWKCPRPPQQNCTTNEVWSKCASLCQDECTPNDCVSDASCHKKCVCQKGFKRINGICVPWWNCPKTPDYKCDVNEEWTNCASNCQDECTPDQCQLDGKCYKKCACKAGYKRIDGECVSEQRCQCSTTPVDECDKNEERNNLNQCVCKSGFRQVNGECVSNLECPLCDDNEEWQALQGCVCKPGFLRVDGECVSDNICPDCDANEELNNQQQCVCKTGFRKVNGECVSQDLCPLCDANEYWDECSNNCQDECSPNNCVVEQSCISQCVCRPGFKRINGECVADSLCPSCDVNEEWNAQNDCVCKTNFRRVNGECVSNDECPVCDANEEWDNLQGCLCKSGYFRVDGECVSTNICPKCDTNEELVSNQCVCKFGFRRVNEECVSVDMCPLCDKNEDYDADLGCVCSLGFRRVNGECVSVSECPQCDANEEWSTSATNCQDLCTPNQCTPDNVQYERCVCLPGYKRIDGECVSETKCPQCDGNEERNAQQVCVCQTNYRLVNGECVSEDECPVCDTNEELNDQQVCVCRAGFRDVNGECVSEITCPVCDTNEVFDPMANQCDCVTGYRKINGECVSEIECPVCDDNEMWSDSATNCQDLCSPNQCIPDGGKYRRCVCLPGYKRIDGECVSVANCPQCDVNEVREGSDCVCRSGFREIDGECVSYAECPLCDKNEVWSSSATNCQDQCVPNNCQLDNIVYEKCVCKPGYKRIDGECVSDVFCPNCGANETWSDTATNCQDSCENVACTPDGILKRQCVCKEGYKRINGVCQLAGYCDPKMCTKYHEYTCSFACLQECEVTDACKAMDPATCIFDCYCEAGKKLDSKGNCVKRDPKCGG